MNFGIHFSLNKKFSRPEDGVYIYNYRNIINTKFNSANSPAHLKYPIYLSISPHEVAFYFHLTYDKSDAAIEHTNSPILILSSSSRTEDHETLTKSIQNIFHDTHNLLINGLKEKRHLHHESISKQLTYSQLKVFSEKQTYRIVSPDNYLYPHKKLFLDFLYDAEHTQVFLSSPAFSTIYDKLNENFLFRSIKNKAEYYYYREAVGDLNLYQRSIAFNRSKAHRLLDYYIEAERQWVSSITDPKAESIFYFSCGWIESCRDEVDHVYEAITKFDTPKKNASYTVADSFEYMNRIRESTYERESDRIRDVANHALLWHQYKLQPTGFYKIMTGNRPIKLFPIHMVLLSVYAIYTFMICYGHNTHDNQYISTCSTIPFIAKCLDPSMILYVMLICLIFPSLVWCISLVKINFSAPAHYIKNIFSSNTTGEKHIHNSAAMNWISIQKSKKIPLTNAHFPRLLAAIIAAWIALSLDGSLNTSFYDQPGIVYYSIPAILATMLFLYHEIRKKNPYLKLKVIVMRSGAYLLISFFYSTLIGIISMSLFAFTYISNYLTSPSTQILPEGMSAITWLETNNMITRIPYNLFGILDEPLYVTIFHHMLIPFSIFAIFIGVCLQSIFGDKSAVEPL